MTREQKKPGQLAYEADCLNEPNYHDGTKRKTWFELDAVAQWSWNRDPTPRKRFPIYASHSVASCFNCGADLDGSYYCDSGNAPNHGQFRQDCEKCRTATWYDLSMSTIASNVGS